MSLTDIFRARTRPLTTAPSRIEALPRPLKSLLVLLVIGAVYLLPFWPDVPVLGWIVDTPGTNFASVVTDQVMIFVLVALGLNVVVGLAGLLDLGYVGFYAVGAYTTAVVTTNSWNLPWLASLPIAIAVSMLSGVILGTPTLRLRGDYLAIVTLGFGEIIRITANNSEWLGSVQGINKIKRPPNIGPFEFGVLNPKPYWYLGFTIILLVIFIIRRLMQSRVGRAWDAIREDEDAAELMGVNTFKFKLWAFAIGAAIGGVAGTLYAGKVTYVSPENFELQLSILFLAALVLGGTGSIYGAILGGVLVAWVPERFRNFEDRRYFVFGVVLVLMMVFRPQGLIPRRGAKAGIDKEPSTGEVSGG